MPADKTSSPLAPAESTAVTAHLNMLQAHNHAARRQQRSMQNLVRYNRQRFVRPRRCHQERQDRRRSDHPDLGRWLCRRRLPRQREGVSGSLQ